MILRHRHAGRHTTLDLVYDKAGNLREQPLTTSTSRRFTHDAHDPMSHRLVKVETGSGSTWATKGEYEYNGLSMRCVKRLDDPDDATSGLDEQRLLYYSGQWQVVEEHVDDAWTSGHTTDRIVQHVWGLRYFDDLVLSREDENADGDYDDAGDSTRSALTDHQFSVIALISDTGTLLERVTYTPYGEARHQWREDVNGDGAVDSADYSAASGGRGSIWQSSYNVDADFDRDGGVDAADLAQISTPSYKSARAPGVLSAPGVGNTIGFCGYVFNPEIGGSGIYTVRFRHYDPALGRWLERDPAGYADSMSLYGYGVGNPTMGMDPYGLAWWNPWSWDDEDEEWERMMRGNQELLRKKLEDQRSRGIISDEEFRRFVWSMTSDLEATLLELELIRAEAIVYVLEYTRNELVITFVTAGGALVLRGPVLAYRAGQWAPGVVWIGYRGGTFFYSVGRGGVWTVRNAGRVYRLTGRSAPAIGRARVPIPVPASRLVPTEMGRLAPKTNCFGGACRSVCDGWGRGL